MFSDGKTMPFTQWISRIKNKFFANHDHFETEQLKMIFSTPEDTTGGFNFWSSGKDMTRIELGIIRRGFKNATEIVKDFYERYPGKPKPAWLD